MRTRQLLEERAGDIIDRAEEGISKACLRHYQSFGRDEIRVRVASLYGVLCDCVARRDLEPVIDYAEKIARERFGSGFELYEVQTAFNVLEEAIWLEIVEYAKPDDLQEAMTMVSGALGMGKDAFARAYVALASEARTPPIDVNRLFRGTDGG